MPITLRFLTFLCFLGLCCTGCKTTHLVSDNKEAAFQEINTLSQKQPATVTLLSRPSMTVKDLSIGYDSTSWSSLRSGILQVVPTPEVREIRFKSRQIKESMGVGVFIGISLAFVLGKESCKTEECISRLDLLPAGILLGAVTGSILGRRREVIYVLSPPER